MPYVDQTYTLSLPVIDNSGVTTTAVAVEISNRGWLQITGPSVYSKGAPFTHSAGVAPSGLAFGTPAQYGVGHPVYVSATAPTTITVREVFFTTDPFLDGKALPPVNNPLLAGGATAPTFVTTGAVGRPL